MKKPLAEGFSNKVFASLKYDFVFREVFSHESILRRFISDVTEIPLIKIKSVRVVTPFLRKQYRKQKQGILDFFLISGDENHTVCSLRDKNGREFSDLFEIHIIELNKKWKGNDAVDEWIRLFNAKTMEDLNNIDTQNTGVQEAMEVIKTMNLVRSLRWMYEEHLKAVRDRWAEDEYVRDEGRAEGKAEGKAEDIIKLLTRFEELPVDLMGQIMQQKDLEILEKWVLAAAEADNLQDFRDRVQI